MAPEDNIFEQHMAFSLLTPKPVIFNKDMCYWMGMFMSKQMAFTISSSIFLHIPITPGMKESLWDITYDVVEEAKRLDYTPPFILSSYTPGRLYGYLVKEIGKELNNQTDPILQDWKASPFEVVEYFFKEQ